MEGDECGGACAMRKGGGDTKLERRLTALLKRAEAAAFPLLLLLEMIESWKPKGRSVVRRPLLNLLTLFRAVVEYSI